MTIPEIKQYLPEDFGYTLREVNADYVFFHYEGLKVGQDYELEVALRPLPGKAPLQISVSLIDDLEEFQAMAGGEFYRLFDVTVDCDERLTLFRMPITGEFHSGNFTLQIGLPPAGSLLPRFYLQLGVLQTLGLSWKQRGLCSKCGRAGSWRPPAALICPEHGLIGGC